MSRTPKLTPESSAILAVVLEQEPRFRALRLVMLIEAGTHLIVDALICPYRIGERVRAKKLLRSVSIGMLLMWDARITFICNGASNTSYWV